MKKRKISKPEPYAMPPELDDVVEEMIRLADADVEEMRVNMRWGGAQIAVVKRAAALFGMPYQTYVKQAAFRQAIADLQAVERLVECSDEQAGGQKQHKTPMTSTSPRKRTSPR
mgnify:CR=1 FL=1